MKKKPLRLTNIAKAEGRIAAILGFGEILTLSDAHGVTFTVGPWTPAVGPRDCFAIYAYGQRGAAVAESARENLTAAEAAGAIVARVGAGRARDAALAADKRAGRQPGRVVGVPTGSRKQWLTAKVVYEASA